MRKKIKMSSLTRIGKISQQIARGSNLLARSASSAAAAQQKLEHTKLFINNQFVEAKSGKQFETINPANGQVITEVSEADKVIHKISKK